ncbi:hypothetical protein KFE25_010614 [Diacronema lutheri]|uniref:Kringle domain-containing protein n=1 Tax=Diacronema lutheri TaxID=2081491 RepID=A0A8J5XD22_DIALT|nr:hypothetical protein KFE25_010614 [Diacronema lutheri]
MRTRAAACLLASVAAATGREDEPAPYAFGGIVRERVDMNEIVFYKTTIPTGALAVKISIAPLFGDADVFMSFEPFDDLEDATFRMEEPGMQEMLLRRSAYDWTCITLTCDLYFAIFGYTTSDYLFRASNFSDPTIEDPYAVECAPGCTHFELTDAECHVNCNTTECMYDGGDCLLKEEYCTRGCPNAFLNDSICDEACFTPECHWDGDACFEGTDQKVGCAPRCLPIWLSNGECDAECNNAPCGWDGDDCFHGHNDCYYEKDGTDYRGTVNRTKSGLACQLWSEQYPQQHTRTARWYPYAGLGGHNYCRNPDNEPSPWCYTTDPMVRWELCEIPNVTATCPTKQPTPDYAAGELLIGADGRCPDETYQRRRGVCAPCTACAEGMEERIKCSTEYDRICAPACAASLSTRFDSQGKGALTMVQSLCAYASYNHSSVASFDAKKLCSSYCCHAFELAAGACDYDGAHLDTWNDIKRNLVLGHETLCRTPVDSCPVFAAAKADSRGDKGASAPAGSGARARGGSRAAPSEMVTTVEAIHNPFVLTMLTLGGASLLALGLVVMWYRRRVKATLLYASPNAPDTEEMQEQPRE